MQNNNQISGFYAAILFLVWPVLALASALKNYRSSCAKNILWAFITFYGLAFAIGAESQDSDIVRYVAEVEKLHGQQMTVGDAVDYYQKNGEVDILRTFIAVTVSRITESQTVLTLIYGFIFGFFFSRNIWFIMDRLKGTMHPFTILLLACLFLVIPFWNINTFRMWTAAHIFLYGLLPYLFEGKKNGIIISSLSIFVHFSFIVPIAILFAYIFLGNRVMIYYGFFIATFFVSQINIEVLNDVIANYAPEVIQEKTSGYRNEQYVEDYREGGEGNRNWYAMYYSSALGWAITAFLTLLYFKGIEFLKQNRNWMNLYCFTLLFYAMANLTSSIPSGGRFVAIANFCSLALIILYLQNVKQDLFIKRFFLATTPLLLLFVLVSVRTGLYSISATAILGNPVIALFLDGDHISLNDLMKMFL